MTQAVPITGEVLRWARDESGMSIDALAAEINVSPGQVEEWEVESRAPSRGQFSRLAEVLRRPSAVFLLPSAPEGSSISPSLRSAPGLGGNPLRQEDLGAIRRAQRHQSILSWYIRDRGSPPIDLPTYRPEADAATAGENARLTSEIGVEDQLEWTTDVQAFRAWCAALERRGVFVQQASLGREGVRGFSLWDDYAPLIVVNSAYHPTARSYSLMHEYGHMLCRTVAACRDFVGSFEEDRSTERWCERFAASFLIPEQVLIQVASDRGITERRPASEPPVVRKVARRFRVSGRAMAIRLTDLGLGTRDLYSKFAAWSKRRDWNEGGGGDSETRIEKRQRELGHATILTLLEALEAGRLNLRDATDYLRLSPNEVDELAALAAGE